MSAPITVPLAQPTEPFSLQHLSPVTLQYLKSLSNSERPLSKEQAAETTISPHDLDQFLKYMSSPASSALSPPPQNDLSYPMSDYFVNSSHNTYLTGNQLYSESSTGAYKIALLRGCRCIEIDVWDGEPKSEIELDGGKPHGIRSHMQTALDKFRHSKVDDALLTQEQDGNKAEDSLEMPKPWTSASTVARAEPRVLHGYTLTKEIPFRDVCKAIRENAFVTSDLPVIVSLEVHATAPQQEIMVEIIQSTFKDHLVNVPANPPAVLPSPEALRNKILIKVKYVDPKKAAAKGMDIQTRPNSSKPTLHHTPSTNSSHSSASSNADDNTPAPSSLSTPDQKQKKKKSAIIPSLSDLGIYTRSYHFSSLTSPDAHTPVHVFSLSEKKIMEVHQSHGPTLFAHNRHFFMRVFPSGLRVRSDNLDPSIFWRKGVQMVALNWQRWDEGMMLNEGMFSGSKGWVLKPKGYLGGGHSAQTSDATKQKQVTSTTEPSKIAEDTKATAESNQATAIAHHTLNLSITLLAAQNIPLPLGNTNPASLHLYLKAELHVEKPAERTGAPIEGGGKSKDENRYKHRTRPTGKGTDIDFGGEQIHFRGVPGVVQELSFLRFKIQDDQIGKDDLAAWACVRLDRLRTGYRFLHVLDAAGRESTGVVLVNIEKSLE